jgi:hypothetical protein
MQSGGEANFSICISDRAGFFAVPGAATHATISVMFAGFGVDFIAWKWATSISIPVNPPDVPFAFILVDEIPNLRHFQSRRAVRIQCRTITQ